AAARAVRATRGRLGRSRHYAIRMRDVLEEIRRAADEGRPTAVATVVAARNGSAPRPVGSKLAVTDDGRIVGSVSGGCVEADVAERARAILAGEAPTLLTYGIADEEAWSVGLPCGSEIDVWLERADPDLWRRVEETLERALRGGAVYVGAVGSRRVQARRREQLAERGLGAEEIAHVSGPAGLDLGGRAPAEIALAIAAEIVATLQGKQPTPPRGGVAA